jgi:peptide/nickel transport system substrate-binding protein
MRVRNSILVVALALSIGVGLPAVSARAETAARYGISMVDNPLMTGQPARGYP